MVAIGLAIVATAGLLLRWGPFVAGTLAGYYAGWFWLRFPPGYAHDGYEAVLQDFGTSVFLAIVGAIGGGWISFCRHASKTKIKGPE
jgi:hypothetical protein